MVPMRFSPRLRGPNGGATACLLLVPIIACASPTTLHWCFSPPLHLTRSRSRKAPSGVCDAEAQLGGVSHGIIGRACIGMHSLPRSYDREDKNGWTRQGTGVLGHPPCQVQPSYGGTRRQAWRLLGVWCDPRTVDPTRTTPGHTWRKRAVVPQRLRRGCGALPMGQDVAQALPFRDASSHAVLKWW